MYYATYQDEQPDGNEDDDRSTSNESEVQTITVSQNYSIQVNKKRSPKRTLRTNQDGGNDKKEIPYTRFKK